MNKIKTIIYAVLFLYAVCLLCVFCICGPGWASEIFKKAYIISTAVVTLLAVMLKVIALIQEDPELNGVALPLCLGALLIMTGYNFL